MPSLTVHQASPIPLLFQKRVSISAKVAAQYVGTDVEMDPKEAMVKPIVESAVPAKG